MGTCVSGRCCVGGKDQKDDIADEDFLPAILSTLRLSNADREKLRKFDVKVRQAFGDLKDATEQVSLLQGQNDSLKEGMKDLAAENLALRKELEEQALPENGDGEVEDGIKGQTN